MLYIIIIYIVSVHGVAVDVSLLPREAGATTYPPPPRERLHSK